MHVDAYAALKAYDPDALATVAFPDHGPVVVVCIGGYTSQIAVEQLAERGIEALSLQGGMKAWSLAWNSAEVPCADDTLRIIQVRRTGKGCLSYLVGTGDEAMVIDASVDPQVYLDLAACNGWKISGVLDTHIHADHLSRSRQLAEQSEATLFLPDQQRATFPFVALRDGDRLTAAETTLRVLHTPGHTTESVCYLLNNHILFTGDTLSLTGVGRPDLQTNAGEAQARASRLYHSLQKLLALPAETLVLPGHTGAPVAFDGQPIVTTLGEIETQVAVVYATRDQFVQTLLARIPPTPPNYALIVRLNERGMLPTEDLANLEAGANRCAIA